jgi:integrase
MARRGHGEGSIYQRKDGRWAASITLEGRKRKTFYGKTRKEVQEQLKVALLEQKQGTLVTSPQQTVEQYLKYWLENVHRQSIRVLSYVRYEEFVRLHLVPAIGHIQMQKLSPQHLQALYARKLDEGMAPKSVIFMHNLMHKALKDAIRWNLVSRNVCDAVSPPRRKRFETHPLNTEQVHQLLEAARGHPQEALFVLALATGMRRGELLGLKWQDINFAMGSLQVRRTLNYVPHKGFVEAEPKTEKSRRSIMLAPFALEVLLKHQTRQQVAKAKAGDAWQERDLVFCTSRGTPLDPRTQVHLPFKKLLKQAGLPNIRFHDLRHSTATMLLSMGVHPKVVQELLGHNQISMTMDIYSHVMPTLQQEAINKLNDTLK